MIDISYEICTVLISAVLLLNYLTTKKTYSLQNLVFQLLILLNALTAIFDMAKRIYMICVDVVQVPIIDLCTMGYFVTHMATMPLLALYLISLMKPWRDVSKPIKVAFCIPVLVAYVILLSNGFTHFVYRILDDGTYIRRNGIFAVYAVALYYGIFSILIMSQNRRNFSHRKKMSLYASLVLVFLGVVIQFLVPTLIVETAFGAICLLLVFFVVQNPKNMVDHNTGMFNRKAFYVNVGGALSNQRDFQLVPVVVHNLGAVSIQKREQIMTMVALHLKSYIKKSVVYRIDSNTLVVALWKITEVQAQTIAEEVLNRFQYDWTVEETSVYLRAKVGILNFPGEIRRMEELRAVIANLRERDIESHIFTEQDFDLKNILREVLVSDALVRALEVDEFEMTYAPIFTVQDNKLVAAEASIKFLNPELGYVYENDIESIAERSGKMAHLTEWLLDQSCQYIADNHLSGTRLRCIMLRLSTSMCLQYGYEDLILDTIRSYHIAPSMICFKVSEYTVSQGGDQLREGMRKMREVGIRFCLENYGSGYTNLSSIYNVTFDFLQISRQLIRDAMENEKSAIILSSTLELAKSLSMKTLVAGVNYEEQVEMLLSMPCDYAQGGYYLGQMQPLDFLAVIFGQVEKKNRLRTFIKSVETQRKN